MYMYVADPREKRRGPGLPSIIDTWCCVIVMQHVHISTINSDMHTIGNNYFLLACVCFVFAQAWSCLSHCHLQYVVVKQCTYTKCNMASQQTWHVDACMYMYMYVHMITCIICLCDDVSLAIPPHLLGSLVYIVYTWRHRP